MRTIFKYEHLLWLILLILFLFVIPISSENLIKLIAAGALYLFLRELFYNRKSEAEIETRISRIAERIGRTPRSRQSTFVHGHTKDSVAKKDTDIRSYL